MSKRGDQNLIVGLDIVPSRVVAIVGEINESGAIEVVGIGSHPSPRMFAAALLAT